MAGAMPGTSLAPKLLKAMMGTTGAFKTHTPPFMDNPQTDKIRLPQDHGGGKAYYIVSEQAALEEIFELYPQLYEALRTRLLAQIPELRADTERFADLLREIVKLERAERGLDNPRGRLELLPNKDKSDPLQPDFIGTGQIAGRHYHLSAWIQKNGSIKIAALPRAPKQQ
jgi:hypothetical protein